MQPEEIQKSLEIYESACLNTDEYEKQFLELISQQVQQRYLLESENYMNSTAYAYDYEKDIQSCKMEFQISRTRENIALHKLELLKLEDTLESLLDLQKPFQEWLTAQEKSHTAVRAFKRLDAFSDALLTVAYADLEPDNTILLYIKDELKISGDISEEELRVIAEKESQNLNSKRMMLEKKAEKAKVFAAAKKVEWDKLQIQVSAIENPQGRFSILVADSNQKKLSVIAKQRNPKIRWKMFGIYWLVVLYLYFMTNAAWLSLFALMGILGIIYILRKNHIDKVYVTESSPINLQKY